MKVLMIPFLVLVFLGFVGCPAAHAGYTHYFTWHQKPDQAEVQHCIADMQRVIEARRSILAGPEGSGLPVVKPSEVEMNGIGEGAHEPFVFPGETGFNFCKTEGKPYDEVVTACLLVARDRFPASVLEIASDGSWEEGDWQKGANLYSSVIGRTAQNPMNGGFESIVKRTGLRSLVPGIVIVGIVVWLLRRKKKSS